MLRVGRDDFGLRPDPEPGEHDVAAVRRRGGQRDERGIDAEQTGEALAGRPAQLQRAVEERLA
jgi:hypothetical protein